MKTLRTITLADGGALRIARDYAWDEYQVQRRHPAQRTYDDGYHTDSREDAEATFEAEAARIGCAELCPDCGKPVEYVNKQHRHIDPCAECFLYPARTN